MQLTKDSSDLELLDACLKQDQRAQYLLFRRFQGRVMSICLRYTGHPAEAAEVCNTVFLKVMTKAAQYEGKGSFEGWIRKIALYSSLDFVRQRAVYQRQVAATEPPDIPVCNEAIERLTQEELLGLIQSLPPACRSVFSLHVIDGFTHEEIAQHLDIPCGTSKWHLASARTLLREKLKKSVYKTLLYEHV